MKSFKQKINAYVGIVVALALLLIWHLNFWFASLLEDHQQESILGADPHAAAFRLENSHGRQGGNEKGKLKNFDHRKQQRQPQPPEQLLSASHDKNNGYSFHIVVSSGCNSLQDWQSYTFFHAIKQSGFEGNVTRVASCETEEQATALKQLHQEQISIMSPNFHLFTTPDFTRMAGPEKYNFFNKPFGVRYWLEHGLGLPANLAEYEKTIMVLMDPDQFLLRPFVQDMAHEQELWHDPTGYRQVKKGQPMAAKYSFGGAWTRDIDVKNLLDVNLTVQRIPKEESGLLRNWNAKYMGKYFAIGAPYVVETADFLEIVQSWAEFVVPIYKQMKAKGKDPFMAEMYGYCAAGAHLNLPHQMSNSFMISEPESGSDSEAWSEWIDGKSSQSVCSPDMSPMPHSFHFCQRYYIGEYFFSKYQVPKSPPDDLFLSCDHPLFKEAPMNVAELFSSALTPNGKTNQLNEKDRIRMAFSVCVMLPRMNAAATFFKDHHCQDPSNPANYSKVYVFETHDVKRARLKRLREARQKKSS